LLNQTDIVFTSDAALTAPFPGPLVQSLHTLLFPSEHATHAATPPLAPCQQILLTSPKTNSKSLNCLFSHSLP